MKVHLCYLANSYFCNYKPSPRILRQHLVLQNLRKNKDIVITRPDKGNGIVILHKKLYDNAHGLKSVQTRSFSGPQFPAFELNMGKYRPKKTPYLDTFDTVAIQEIISDASKFGKLNEKPTLKREASRQRPYVS